MHQPLNLYLDHVLTGPTNPVGFKLRNFVQVAVQATSYFRHTHYAVCYAVPASEVQSIAQPLTLEGFAQFGDVIQRKTNADLDLPIIGLRKSEGALLGWRSSIKKL